MSRAKEMAAKDAAAKAMASNIMNWPVEVRVMVYKLCIPVGETLVLKPTACERKEIKKRVLRATKLPVLLRVNQAMREEAACVFFMMNTWRVVDIPPSLSLSDLFEKYVRRATATFDRRIIKMDDLFTISDEVFESQSRRSMRLEEIHDNMKTHLLDLWKDKCEILGRCSLKELTVDFSGCKCPLGCCRMFMTVAKRLVSKVTFEEKRITVRGMKYQSEAGYVHLADMRCDDCWKGPEKYAAENGYCWRSALESDDEEEIEVEVETEEE